jgi:hypothetical protein
MPRCTAPLVSLAAAGTLIPGLTFRQRGGVTILERTPAHAAPHSQIAHARQLCTTALATRWPELPDSDRTSWNQIVPWAGPTPYHAYLHINLSRIFKGLPTSTRWPIQYIDPPANLSAVTAWYSPNHARFYINSPTIAPRDFDVAWRTQTLPARRSPYTLVGIWNRHGQSGNHRHDETNIPPGTWYYYFTGYRTAYGQYPGLGWYTVTIPAP